MFVALEGVADAVVEVVGGGGLADEGVGDAETGYLGEAFDELE